MRVISVGLVLFVVMISACKKEKPVLAATVSTNAVTAISSNSVQTGGTISGDGGSPVAHAGICWATHTNPTISDSVTATATLTADFTVILSTLNANTKYYIRAYAENEAGTAYGNEISFSTTPGLPTVKTNDISYNQALQAQTGGAIVNDGGAPISASGLVWSLSPHPTLTDSVIINAMPAIDSFTDTLKNLALATYYVRAYATNSFGTGYGNEISFTVSTTGTVVDNDGNIYPTVEIGSQTWMVANLRVTHYQNGDTIANGLSGFDWSDSVGAYTFPNGDSLNNALYGKLYNIYAVIDVRNIAPPGWHVATDSDWQALEFYAGMSPADTAAVNARGTVGGQFIVGGALGLNLQNTGGFDPSTLAYVYFGMQGYFWTTTVAGPGLNWQRGFNTVVGDPGPIYRAPGNLVCAVRCVKN